MPEPISVKVVPITTPKTWTPQELEQLNNNFFLIQEALNKMGIRLSQIP